MSVFVCKPEALSLEPVDLQAKGKRAKGGLASINAHTTGSKSSSIERGGQKAGEHL